MSDEDIDDDLVEDIDDDLVEGEEGSEGEEESEDEEESGGQKFGWKKILLFAVLPAFLLIGGVSGAYFAGVFDSFLGDEQQAEDPAALATVNVFFYDLPEMLVNLSTSGSENTYLKISVSLEIEDPTIAPQLDGLVPSIVENFQLYLRDVPVEDLNGSAGLYRLKEELLVRVITATQPLRIKDILFREMRVQ